MREIIARSVCVLTVCVVVAVSFLFASAHNPRLPAKPVRLIAGGAPVANEANGASGRPSGDKLNPGSGAPPVSVDRGRAVYAEQNCSSCHSITGVGTPRHALDGVGARRDKAALKAWVTGSGAAAGALPAAIVKRKQRYQNIPTDDLNALISYLSGLRTAE